MRFSLARDWGDCVKKLDALFVMVLKYNLVHVDIEQWGVSVFNYVQW